MGWEDLVKIPLGAYPKNGEPFTAITGTKENIATLMTAVFDKGNDITIFMPCGYERVLHDEIPQEDIPCPCGRVGRFLVKIE